jgi:hypothetical protein
MKKLLLTALAATTLSMSANAVVQKGGIAPDFTLTDINNVTHHLYDYLDSGYTVIIDVSAAWCGPCWAAHTSGVLDNLMDHYGPNGSITPKKIMVFFIEGEATNTLAQLQGTTTAQTNAGYSQGDWITGTKYPIIDNASQNSNYLDGGFPTFTVIGRDRIVYDINAGYGSSMGVESYWLNIVNQAPTTGPSATIDAKPLAYNGQDVFICSATPTFKFQNYSQTQNITSATMKLYAGSTVVSTQTWTGNLAPYGVASVTMPTYTPTAGQNPPYKFEVVVTGDSDPTNNMKSSSFSKILTSANAGTTPYSENLESSTTATGFPGNIIPSSSMIFFFDGTGSTQIIGANGQATKTAVINYFDNQPGTTADLLMSNFNTAALSHPTFEFDVAYAQYGGTENDKLEVMVSKDCGTTWNTLYSESGTTLATHTPVGNNTQFIPKAAADWKHKKVYLDNYKDANLFIKFKATSAYGNMGFLDNFQIKANATSVNDLITENSVSLYPNPTSDMATLTFDVTKASTVTVQVLDITGRVVANVANENMAIGTQKVTINTANLPSGVYNVKIQTEAGSSVQRLTVVK